MAEKLTPQQKAAVEDRGGKLLVSAAAGSGKTKVLVDRLLQYLLDPVAPANIDDFLIITYTKAAASELRGKIAAKISEKIAQDPENRHLQHQMQRLYLTKISTVHSFCGDILREYAYKLDLTADFRVAEETECALLQQQVLEQLLENAYASLSEDPQLQEFLDTQGLGRDDGKIPQILMKVYQSSRCHLDPEKWLSWCESSVQTADGSDPSQTPWGAYLMGDLKQQVRLHADAMERCRACAAETEGMEKVEALLASNIQTLRALEDCETWDAVYAAKNLDFGRLTIPKNCKDLALSEQIKAVRDACKKKIGQKLAAFADPGSQVLGDFQNTGKAVCGLIALVRRFDKEYEHVKRRRRILDFGDLEHKMLDLLMGKARNGITATAGEIGERFREILVDEYQDSNQVQDTIFAALTEKKQNCFMVGDVKQSIYQFRLADPGIFLDKYHAYVPAEDALPMQGRKVLLSQNFRSAGHVVAAVNDVFSECMSPEVGGLYYTDAEKLYEGIPHAAQTEPEVELYGITVREDTYEEEAAFAAGRICELLDGSHYVREGDSFRPIVPEDIVILLRSPNSVGGEFLYALEQKGIRCEITGTGVDLLETEEIATLRALLQTIYNPLQEIPLVAVLSSRLFSFTADMLAEVRAKDKKCNFYKALQQSPMEAAKDFLKTLTWLREQAKMQDVTQLLQTIHTVTKMDSIYGALPDGDVRCENLHAFSLIALQWEKIGHRDLGSFLDYLHSLEEKGISSGGEQRRAGVVTIMSIHKSKGLEFPVVFLCGLSRAFNQESAREQVLCDQELGLGLSCINPRQRVRYPTGAKRAIAAKMIRQSISEEMRVLYVAMTRAKDRLVMTYADDHLQETLTDLVLRMDVSDSALLCSEASCPGRWILYSALKRTEAGAFFALGGKPECACVREVPWHIGVVEGTDAENQGLKPASDQVRTEKIDVQRLKESLAFSYPRQEATLVPSKQTATQLKGRIKDQEAAQETAAPERSYQKWRTPSFIEKRSSGTDYGNAVHAVMQRIRYAVCGTLPGVIEELSRIERNGYLTQEQLQRLDPHVIYAFFQTELGRQLVTQEKDVLREFKFSVLVDADETSPQLQGEKVLLQGVVDCALIEEDGITVIDFKTDAVTEESLPFVAQKYFRQVNAYASAMERIFEKPVKRAWLYFFRKNAFIPVE